MIQEQTYIIKKMQYSTNHKAQFQLNAWKYKEKKKEKKKYT